MAYPTYPTLAVRAYSADPMQGAGRTPRARAPLDGKHVLDRASGPAFIIELSAAAQRITGADDEMGRAGNKRRLPQDPPQPAGPQQANLSDNPLAPEFEDRIDAGGAGRREAPMSASRPQAVFRPAGSVIDIRV